MKKVFHVAVCALVLIAFGLALHRMLGSSDTRPGQRAGLLQSLLPWDTSDPPRELTVEEQRVELPTPKQFPSSGKQSFGHKQLHPEMDANERRLFKAIHDSSNEHAQELELGEISDPNGASEKDQTQVQECRDVKSLELLALPDSSIRIVHIKSCEETLFLFIWDERSSDAGSGA